MHVFVLSISMFCLWAHFASLIFQIPVRIFTIFRQKVVRSHKPQSVKLCVTTILQKKKQTNSPHIHAKYANTKSTLQTTLTQLNHSFLEGGGCKGLLFMGCFSCFTTQNYNHFTTHWAPLIFRQHCSSQTTNHKSLTVFPNQTTKSNKNILKKLAHD